MIYTMAHVTYSQGHMPWWWGYYSWLGRSVAVITVTMALLALARLRRPPQRTTSSRNFTSQ